jgi:signal peptidase II
MTTDTPRVAAPPRAPRATRLKVVAFSIVVVGVVLDLWTKAVMQDLLMMVPGQPGERSIEVIPGFLSWSGTWNPGITFGLAQDWTYSILLFTIVACVGLIIWLALSRSSSRTFHVGLALILSGALGNLYDRAHWQKVRDFVLVYWKDPSAWSWYAFNLADSMIVVGVGVVLFRELFLRGKAAPQTAPS